MPFSGFKSDAAAYRREYVIARQAAGSSDIVAFRLPKQTTVSRLFLAVYFGKKRPIQDWRIVASQ
jgi:hypothetical protein